MAVKQVYVINWINLWNYKEQNWMFSKASAKCFTDWITVKEGYCRRRQSTSNTFQKHSSNGGYLKSVTVVIHSTTTLKISWSCYQSQYLINFKMIIKTVYWDRTNPAMNRSGSNIESAGNAIIDVKLLFVPHRGSRLFGRKHSSLEGKGCGLQLSSHYLLDVSLKANRVKPPSCGFLTWPSLH